MLKILQTRLQKYVNCELPDVHADLEKAEEPEIKLPTSVGSSKKQVYCLLAVYYHPAYLTYMQSTS